MGVGYPVRAMEDNFRKNMETIRKDLMIVIESHPEAMANSSLAIAALLELALNIGLQTHDLQYTQKLFNLALESALPARALAASGPTE